MCKAEQAKEGLENETIPKCKRVIRKEQGNNYNQACNTSYASFWSSQHTGQYCVPWEMLCCSCSPSVQKGEKRRFFFFFFQVVVEISLCLPIFSIFPDHLASEQPQIQEFSMYDPCPKEDERILKFQLYGWSQSRHNSRRPTFFFPNEY